MKSYKFIYLNGSEIQITVPKLIVGAIRGFGWSFQHRYGEICSISYLELIEIQVDGVTLWSEKPPRESRLFDMFESFKYPIKTSVGVFYTPTAAYEYYKAAEKYYSAVYFELFCEGFRPNEETRNKVAALRQLLDEFLEPEELA